MYPMKPITKTLATDCAAAMITEAVAPGMMIDKDCCEDQGPIDGSGICPSAPHFNPDQRGGNNIGRTSRNR